MNKIRNISLAVVLSVVLIGALACVIMRGITLLDGKPGQSYLEGRTYQNIPETTLETVSSGMFQTQFEQFAADSIPLRNDVVLANAQMQRLPIRISSALFGFSEYHTYYGSDYVYSARTNAISEDPDKRDSEKTSRMDEAANALVALMKKNKKINWYFALTDRSCNSRGNPAHDLVSKPADSTYLNEALTSEFGELCEVVDLSIGDSAEYYEKYFSTDHHWRIQGALDAYARIMDATGRSQIETNGTVTAYEGPFYGSCARTGRIMDVSDSLDDVLYERSELKVSVNETDEKPESYLDSSYEDEGPFAKENEYENVYARYFHGDPALITIENQALDDGPSLLIIGDSFTNNIERLFSETYKTVYVLDPRWYKKSPRDFIKAHDIDDAVVLISSTTLFANNAIETLSR